MSLIKTIVPVQKKGSQTGATSKITTGTASSAKQLFDHARSRLLAINDWRSLCGEKGAEFRLTDRSGMPINAAPEVGHLIRIKLPAPPNKSGDGFDWVRIEKFETANDPSRDEELFGFRVRPVKSPTRQKNESAHFYTSDATSTFLIYREATTVYAMERGRNELPNPSGTILNKIRNILVAIPAMLGLSKPQWKNLTDGLLNY